ncbi:hypothetical protein Agub_g7731, partial [Astrephomene gubernaculifera]
MSWPMPSGATSAGPAPPAIALPWPTRGVRRPVRVPASRHQRNGRNPQREASMRKAKYAAGMLAGVAVVAVVKRLVASLPLLGGLARPVLDLFPTLLVGPALGAALVYGNEQGDLLAARHVVRQKAGEVRQEFEAVVRDVREEVRAANEELSRRLERSQDVYDSTARAAVQSVAELERSVVPLIEREYRSIEAAARRALQDGR